MARGRGWEGGGTLVLGKARRPEEEASRSQQVRETVGQEGSEERDRDDPFSQREPPKPAVDVLQLRPLELGPPVW